MNGNITIITKDNFVKSLWSGGSTTQLFIYPENSVYANRDFIWRLSSATVEDESSTFTALPNYKRIISTIQGSMVLQHNDGEKITLKPFVTDSFDGADTTTSAGRCTDFNLMMKKDYCDGFVQALTVGDKSSIAINGAYSQYKYKQSVFAIYSPFSDVTLSVNGEKTQISCGDLAVVSGIEQKDITIINQENEKLQMFVCYIFF